jgi:hypothetical protein
MRRSQGLPVAGGVEGVDLHLETNKQKYIKGGIYLNIKKKKKKNYLPKNFLYRLKCRQTYCR